MMITVLSALLAGAFSLCAQPQQSREWHRERYDRQVKNVGIAGVGVGTILEKWENDYPEDLDMLNAKFEYYLAKSMSDAVVQKDSPRYLGMKPVLTLKDSTGADVYYYQDTVFDDETFSIALSAAEKASVLSPLELRPRLNKISALMAYEKESPELAFDEINSLIDKYVSSRTSAWTLDGEALSKDPKAIDPSFSQAVGEYCYSLFAKGSPQAYDFFFRLSTRMNKLEPKNTVFIDNMGSYYLVAKKDNKKAEKYYKKALKIEPEDYAAISNLKIIQSSKSKKGQSSK